MRLNPQFALPTAPAPETGRRLPISPRVCLVDVAAIRAMRGCPAEKVFADVDEGRLLWAFNLSRRPGNIRDLRVWVEELNNPAAVAGIDLETVVSRVFPPGRETYPTGEICLRFLISKPTWLRIRRELGQPAGRVKREPLARFLASRWIGNWERGQK